MKFKINLNHGKSAKKIQKSKLKKQNKEVVIIKQELLDPKSDYVFKRIFGYVGNEELTKDLLNAIINERITKVELDKNPILERDLLNDKMGIMDIRTTINNTTNINIEMQMTDENNIEKRLLYYWSKLYIKGIKKSQDYSELKRTIAILFINFELENLKNIEKYITQWNIREKDNHRVILTKSLEIYIIELPKARKNSKYTKLDAWVKFIKNPGDIDMSEDNKAIKKAKEILEDISNDEHERYLADLREKYILDKVSMENSAMRKGIEKGRMEGIKQNNIEIAKKMKEDKLKIEIIIKYTGLTKEEIEEL